MIKASQLLAPIWRITLFPSKVNGISELKEILVRWHWLGECWLEESGVECRLYLTEELYSIFLLSEACAHFTSVKQLTLSELIDFYEKIERIKP